TGPTTRTSESTGASSLVGEDRNSTIIDGNWWVPLEVVSDWVNVTSLTLRNASILDAGIAVYFAQNCHIDDVPSTTLGTASVCKIRTATVSLEA
ncbi:MAG: hypothetical protein KAW09_09300, partial [Thermoplasmata archaeon]|nr:hypothetical protein [Thermoplasmata archaeon]